MALTKVLGKDCKLYYGAEETVLSQLTEVTSVRDLSLSLDSDEGDVTTRASGGFRSRVQTLRTCEADFELLWIPGNAVFEAIRDAYLGGTLLEFAILTGDKDTANSEGPKGAFSVMSFTRVENLDGIVTAAVKIVMSDYDQWVEVVVS